MECSKCGSLTFGTECTCEADKLKREAKNKKARERAKARREVYESLGLTRGRDSMGRVMYD